MPKIKGRVIKAGAKDGKLFALVQMDGKLPRVGEIVAVKWGATRSTSQNALYWTFLTWLLDAGLKDEYGTAEELHESLKAAYLSSRNKLGLLKIASTADLGKSEFGEYMDKINQMMTEYCGINTAPFWENYAENHQAV